MTIKNKPQALSILELNPDQDYDLKQIEAAYKKMCLKTHPDKNYDHEEEATKKFKEVSEAYQYLINPTKTVGFFLSPAPASAPHIYILKRSYGENNSDTWGITRRIGSAADEHIQEFLKIEINQPTYNATQVDISFTGDIPDEYKKPLTEKATNDLIAFLERQRALECFVCPSWMLNEKQHERILTLLQKNAAERQNIQAKISSYNEKSNKVQNYVSNCSAILAFGLSFLCSAPSFSSVALCCLLGWSTRTFIKTVMQRRENYIQSAMNEYDTLPRIREFEPEVFQSLSLGIEATDWKNYLVSFTKREAYSKSFYVGLRYAVHENDIMVDLIETYNRAPKPTV